jgi:ribosomal protein L12E/L44/L45/RPP1/RPP2
MTRLPLSLQAYLKDPSAFASAAPASAPAGAPAAAAKVEEKKKEEDEEVDLGAGNMFGGESY